MTTDNTSTTDSKNGKQIPIEFFTVSAKRERDGSDDKEQENKKPKLESNQDVVVINASSNSDANLVSDSDTRQSIDTTILSEKKLTPREQERENKRLAKLAEEERKRELKQQKKLEEEERRRLKKLADEEERRLKREKIEREKKLRLEQKENERLEKLRKREEELKAREEKKKREEEEKVKRREEIERKRIEKIQEKEKLEQEKQQKKLEEENKLKKRSIMNFFKVKSDAVEVVPEVPAVNEQTEFDKYFLPFHVRPNVTMHNNSIPLSNKWTEFIKNPSQYKPEPIETSSSVSPSFERASSVLQCLNSGSINEANRLFTKVPLKYFKFYESKKPTYFGTFSYTTADIVEDVNLRLNPFTKITVNTLGEVEGKVVDYEYDSEADIADDDEEGDEEGEDINSGEEDDEDDEDDEDNDELDSSDIDEFVETDTAGPRQTRTIGPLTAVVRTCHDTIDAGDEFGAYFRQLRWEQLNQDITFPIDPHHNYWARASTSTTTPCLSAAAPAETCAHSAAPAPAAPSQSPTTAASPTATASPMAIPPPMLVKKKTIALPQHVAALLAFVAAHRTLSLATLAELAVKDPSVGLSRYSRAQVKNAIREHAVFDKRAGAWTVSPHT